MTPISKVSPFNLNVRETVISAKIPSKHSTFLSPVVLEHNMHKLCGHPNLSAVFMMVNICSKRFLKDFFKETSRGKSQLHGSYRRRSRSSNGKAALKPYCTSKGASITGTVDNFYDMYCCPELPFMFSATSMLSFASSESVGLNIRSSTFVKVLVEL